MDAHLNRLTAMAKTTAYQRLIFEVQKLVELLGPELYICVKYLNSFFYPVSLKARQYFAQRQFYNFAKPEEKIRRICIQCQKLYQMGLVIGSRNEMWK